MIESPISREDFKKLIEELFNTVDKDGKGTLNGDEWWLFTAHKTQFLCRIYQAHIVAMGGPNGSWFKDGFVNRDRSINSKDEMVS